MTDRKQLPGKFTWFELVSKDAKKAQAFYAEVFGWRVVAFPMGSSSYDMIYRGDTMIGGYAALKSDGEAAHWLSYVSVEDVDAAVKSAARADGSLMQAARDVPGAGRMAQIVDPQGATLCLFKSDTGDLPDALTTPHGGWLWNELHTSDPIAALRFYEQVVGYTHRTMDMGPAGSYHVLSKGGTDRGGVTAHLKPGAPPHWLPYVSVDDADAAVARARKAGGTIVVPAEDIPGIGRFGVLRDPTGAFLALMKPALRQEAA
jgi:uncharacterized protein